MNGVYFINCWCYYLCKKKNHIIKLDRFGYFLIFYSNLTSLQVDQQKIFGPDNHSTGSVMTWAVKRIPRELGVTCNTGPYRITVEIVKDDGLGYNFTSLVQCRRVIVTLMLLWQGSYYINGAGHQGLCYINGAMTKDHVI